MSSKAKEHSHYIRSEKADRDKAQSKFSVQAEFIKPEAPKEIKISPRLIVHCPFCLFRGKLQRFMVSDSQGISRYKAKCPECKTGMLMRTLIALSNMNDRKIEDYARWCFMYSLNGFWDKVKWETWSKRLAKYEWTITFWGKYRALKGEAQAKYNPEGVGE